VIVSHAHRFIFFAVPKTGSQSIRAALRLQMGAGDWEQAEWGVSKRVPIAELSAIGHGHVRVAEARQWLSPEIWSSYLKFACVRNPWHRFVSCAFFKNATQRLFAKRPQACMKLLLQTPQLTDNVFYRPQLDFLTDDGAMAVDVVLRVETLQRDFDMICDRLGLRRSLLTQLNRSDHGDPKDYLDAELIRDVARVYARDIEAFGYTYDEPEN
jgi:hypothetical protein